MTREIARQNYTSILFGRYDSSTDDSWQSALARPDNLGAQLNAITNTYSSNSDRFTDNLQAYPSDDETSAPPKIQNWFQRIETRFPQPWLRPYIASVRPWEEKGKFDSFPRSGSRTDQLLWLKHNRILSPQTLQLRADIEAEAKREPRNAFWIVLLAQWEWSYAPRTFYPSPRSNFAFAQPTPAPVYAAVAAPPPGYIAPPPALIVAPLSPTSGPTPAPLGPYPLPPLIPNEDAVIKRTSAILQRARSCTYFEDGHWQAKSEIYRYVADSTSLPLEESLSMLGYASMTSQPARQLQTPLWGVSYLPSPSVVVPYAPIKPPVSLGERTSPKQLLDWGATLAHIARLTDRKLQFAAPRTERPASVWLNIGWTLDVGPSGIGGNSFPRTGSSAIFAAKAQQLGIPDLAKEALATENELAVRDTLVGKADAFTYHLPRGAYTVQMRGANALLPRFAFMSEVWCRLIVSSIMFLAILWFFLTLWLIGTQGQPSPRTARWIPAFLFAILLGTPTLWIIGWLLWSISSLSPPTMQLLSSIGVGPLELGSPLFVVFCGTLAVFLALWCMVVTVARHHKALVLPTDDRWHTHFLSPALRPWTEPMLVATSTVMILVSGGFLSYFTLSPGTGTTPVPLEFLGINTMRDVIVALGAYGLGSGALGIIGWLIKWRFNTRTVPPLTHTGLRWWKECIGASICVLVWLYLLVALAAWPSRAAAKRMIAERWQMGDWAWLQKNL